MQGGAFVKQLVIMFFFSLLDWHSTKILYYLKVSEILEKINT